MKTPKTDSSVSITIRPVEASGPGALDGYAMECSCGERATSSLASGIDAIRQGHQRWHNSEAARKAAIRLDREYRAAQRAAAR